MIILGIAIFAAAIRPGGDLVSPIVLGVTMYILFELTSSRSGGAASERSGRAAATRRGVADGRCPSRAATAPGAVAAGEDREGQHVVILSGLSGAARPRRRSSSRTSATRWSTTCRRAAAELAELVSDEPERFEKDRDRARRPVRRRRRWRSGRCAARSRVAGSGPQVFFLEARDEVLIRRFSETRHRHPLADQRGIASRSPPERRLLDPVRSESDVVIDTSDLSLRELRERIFNRLGSRRPDRLAIQLISSASSTACRSRPTSSSTSGSCRTRITSRSSASSPA